MTEVASDRLIDARGMACPGPLMSLVGAIRQGQAGDVFEVWSTDAGSRSDIAPLIAGGPTALFRRPGRAG